MSESFVRRQGQIAVAATQSFSRDVHAVLLLDLFVWNAFLALLDQHVVLLLSGEGLFARALGVLGFNDCDLSRLWPDQDGWILEETPAMPFTHCFAARRSTDAGNALQVDSP